MSGRTITIYFPNITWKKWVKNYGEQYLRKMMKVNITLVTVVRDRAK